MAAVAGKPYKQRRHWVGRTKDGTRAWFMSAVTPTETSHGHLYTSVLGPFRTKQGAEWCRDHPNSMCRTIKDFEDAARQDLDPVVQHARDTRANISSKG